LAVAVVAMHQLGAGHQLSMSSGHAVTAAVHAAKPVTMGTTPVVDQHGVHDDAAQPVAPLPGQGCNSCASTADESLLTGHGASMLCLAVLPLLLALVRRRQALLTRRHRMLAPVGGTAAMVTQTGPPFALPSRICLTRLCVSRT
jgi:hypothetical protein